MLEKCIRNCVAGQSGIAHDPTPFVNAPSHARCPAQSAEVLHRVARQLVTQLYLRIQRNRHGYGSNCCDVLRQGSLHDFLPLHREISVLGFLTSESDDASANRLGALARLQTVGWPMCSRPSPLPPPVTVACLT